MKVLLIGGGGREHALGWKIAQSPLLSTLYLAPGNPGLNSLGHAVAINYDDPAAVQDFCLSKMIDLVVVGPEAPLADGLADHLAAAGIACFGASREAAKLETSKAFTKEICAAVNAPTAAYGRFTQAAPAKAFLDTQSAPYVIKADGLAAGKGVVIAETREDADAAVDDMLGGQFGAAGAEIVIEEFMTGEEASFFAICDGTRILPLIAAQDHKRAFDGDEGPNTGGMGVYAPAPVFNDKVREKTIEKIIKPVISEMARRGTPFRGVLYAGLMIENDEPQLIEFNVRFGDPECQALMRLLSSDILPLLKAAADGDISGHELNWSDAACAVVVLATKGYPGSYEKGSIIKGTEAANAEPGTVLFHAGTKQVDANLTAVGGRVLNVTATADDLKTAIAQAYRAVDKIDWPEGFYRRDIGWRAIGQRTADGQSTNGKVTG